MSTIDFSFLVLCIGVVGAMITQIQLTKEMQELNTRLSKDEYLLAATKGFCANIIEEKEHGRQQTGIHE